MLKKGSISVSSPAPLYEQLKATLRDRIEKGDLKPSSRLPSQTALCKTFEVSQITVRRAIQELVEEGYLYARPGSGTYVVDEAQLKKNTPEQVNVAIIFQDIVGGYPLIKLLLRAIQEECKGVGYGLQFLELPGNESHETAKNCGWSLNCVGAILASPVDMEMFSHLRHNGIPYVLVHNDIADGVSYSVSCNYAAGILQATKHLYEQGCRKLALVTAEEMRYSAGQMSIGFNLASQVIGSGQEKLTSVVIRATYNEEEAYKVACQWVDKGALPDGAIFASDPMARAAVFAFQQRGIKVPEDILVVGFGNTLQSYETPIELTTVDAHNERTGKLAMQILCKLIEGSEKPDNHRVLIEPELVIRESTQRTG